MSSSQTDLRHFEVRLSYLKDRTPSPSGRAWLTNTEVHVLCATLERAVELAREKYPDAVMHAVQPRSSNVTMIVDEHEQKPSYLETAEQWYNEGVRLGFITTSDI